MHVALRGAAKVQSVPVLEPLGSQAIAANGTGVGISYVTGDSYYESMTGSLYTKSAIQFFLTSARRHLIKNSIISVCFINVWKRSLHISFTYKFANWQSE